MFNEQIKLYRQSLGLTQTDIARKIGVSRQAYQHYEQGDREPTFDTLKKLCIIFDCTADELLEIDTIADRKKVTISHSFNGSNNINVKL